MAEQAIAIIPARLGSTRFPAKALADETGKPLVVHVCEQAAQSEHISRVVVATDADPILDAVQRAGFEAVMTDESHPNGTSRLVEAAGALKLKDHEVVVNVQGDEPEIESQVIEGAITALNPDLQLLVWPQEHMVEHCYQRSKKQAYHGVGTVITPIRSDDEFENPNVVKAVVGEIEPDHGIAHAIYFSRAPIPANRDGADNPVRFRHVGIYAYTMGMLKNLPTAAGVLERLESLEQLRWVEVGIPITAAIRQSSHTGIDTPEQYGAFVERHAQKMT